MAVRIVRVVVVMIVSVVMVMIVSMVMVVFMIVIVSVILGLREGFLAHAPSLLAIHGCRHDQRRERRQRER